MPLLLNDSVAHVAQVAGSKPLFWGVVHVHLLRQDNKCGFRRLTNFLIGVFDLSIFFYFFQSKKKANLIVIHGRVVAHCANCGHFCERAVIVRGTVDLDAVEENLTGRFVGGASDCVFAKIWNFIL